MFIRFVVIHERDGRTDRQTDGQTLHDSIDRACIASRGKKTSRLNLILRQKSYIAKSLLTLNNTNK